MPTTVKPIAPASPDGVPLRAAGRLFYRVSGRTVSSNFVFPELLESDGPAQWHFELVHGPAPESVPPPACFHNWSLPDGRVWLFVGRDGSEDVLRFPGMAEFRIAGDSITCQAVPDLPEDTLRHLFLDQVVPLLLSREGSLVLHASVAADSTRALAFVGSTGFGKSTLAASFAADGFEILTDDCVVLEGGDDGLRATPVYSSLRLLPETVEQLFPDHLPQAPVAHYSLKERIGSNAGVRFRTRAALLNRIYFLKPGPTVHVESMSPREGFVEILKHAFMMNVDQRAALSAEFHAVARAAGQPLFRRLFYPHDFTLLPSVHSEIFKDLQIA